MNRGFLVTAAVLISFAASATPAAAQSPAAIEVIRLANGSMLMGRVVSSAGGSVHIQVDGAAEMVVDSAAVVSRSPVPPPPAAPSPWTAHVSVAAAYKSEIVPGLAGSQLGVELKFGVARALHMGGLSLDGSLGYERVQPNTATVNEWSVVAGWRHAISSRFMGLGRAAVASNHVQEVSVRLSVLSGVGAYLVKTQRLSLIVAPVIGYSRSEQTQRGAVMSFAAGEPSGASGMAIGVHDMLTIQLGLMLSLNQSALWLRTLGAASNRQAQFDTRLVGMVTQHIGLMIVYEQQYDSSMPVPVHKTIRSINSGIQFKL